MPISPTTNLESGFSDRRGVTFVVWRARLFGVNRSVPRILGGAFIAAVVCLASLFGAGLPASAETPTEVVEASEDTKVYVARARRDIDPSMFDQALADAAAAGLNLVIVVPADPQPSAKAFALRVRQAGEDIDAVLVLNEEMFLFASISDDYSDSAARATDVAQSKLSPAAGAEAFVHELTVELEFEEPALYRRLADIAVYLMLILAAAVIVEILWRLAKRKALASWRARSAEPASLSEEELASQSK